MYSDTSGISYENDDLPGERDDPDEAEHEPELERVGSYPRSRARSRGPQPPEPPTLPDVMDGTLPDVMDDALPDVTGQAPNAEERAGIDALLTDDSPIETPEADVPDPAEGNEPRTEGAMRIAGTAQPARPSAVRSITSAARPAEGGGEEDKVARLGTILGGISGLSRGNGGEPRRQRVLDVVMDARMRYWRERVILMVVVLVVFWIIGDWRMALTFAVVAGIAHAIWRSRSIASIPPGTKLDRAQRMTQRKLGRMERSGYRALHARPIPGSDQFIDHLVVGPTGVYAVDSEKWNKKLPIRTRNGKQLWLGPESKKPRLEHAKWEAERASELLGARLGREIKVRPALAIYGPHIPWDIAVIRDVDVFNGDRLRRYLRKRSRVREVPKLPRDEIAKIYEAAEVVFPLAGSPEPATV